MDSVLDLQELTGAAPEKVEVMQIDEVFIYLIDLQCDDQAPCDTEHTICGKREPRDVSKLQSEKRDIECRR